MQLLGFTLAFIVGVTGQMYGQQHLYSGGQSLMQMADDVVLNKPEATESQASVTTYPPLLSNNGQSGVTFEIESNQPIVITGLDVVFSTATSASLWMRTGGVEHTTGQSPSITAANGWSEVISNATVTGANSTDLVPMDFGTNEINIPANTRIGFFVEGNLRYQTGTASDQVIYTDGTLTVIVDDPASYGGSIPSPSFNPRRFLGEVFYRLGVVGNCTPFSDFSIDSISGTAARVTWTPGAGNSTYGIEYGAQGFTLGTGTLLSGTYPGAQPREVITGLSPNTNYDLYFAEFCNGGADTAYFPTPQAFTTTAACAPPTNLTESNVMATSVDLSWNYAGSTPQNFIAYYGPPGFTPGDASSSSTSIGGGMTSATVSGLNGNTDYELYLTADCGASTGVSDTVGPVSFSTLCATFVAPYFENFDNVSVTSGDFGNCWEGIPGTTSSFSFRSTTGTTPSGSTGPSGDATTGSGVYLFTEASSGGSGDIAELYSPFIDISGLATAELRYAYHMYGAHIDTVKVQVNDGGGWQTEKSYFGQTQTTNSDPWETDTVDLSAYSGTVQVRFWVRRGTSFNCDVAIDDVIIEEPVNSDLELVSAEFVKESACLSAADTLEFEVRNVLGGTYDLSSTPLTINYDVSGPVNTSGSVVVNSGTIGPGATLTAQATNIDLSVPGSYSAMAWLSPNAFNLSPLNDTLLNPATISVAPLLSVNPKTDSINSPLDSVTLRVASPLIDAGTFLITEICHFQTSTGAPAGGFPAYVPDDYIEITGVPGSDLNGFTLEQWSTSSMNSSVTFGPGTVLSPNGTAIIGVGTGNGNDPANYTYDGRGSSGTYGSATATGRILKDPSGNIIDAVGYPGSSTYSFPAASGVTAADWSGNTSSASGTSGIRLTGPDNNTASNWVVSSSTNPQDPNVLNSGVPLPSPPSVSGFEWLFQGNSVSTDLELTVGPYTTSGTYEYVAIYKSVCGSVSDTATIYVNLPSCPDPANLGVMNVTATTAEVYWTSAGGTDWEVEYGPTGFSLGSGTRVSVTNDTTTLTGLSPITTYDVYVRDSCGVGDVSNFIGPVSFTTPIQGPLGVTCVTGNPAVAFSEEFDSQGGWTGDIGTGNAVWRYNSGTTGSGSTGPSGAHSGSNYIYFEASSTGNASLVTPMIDLSQAQDSAELSFWMHAYGDDIGPLAVGVSTNSATGPFNDTVFFYNQGQLQTSSNDPWQQVGVRLDQYVGQQIWIEFFYSTSATFHGDLALDLVEIETCLSCGSPSALGVTNITSSSADVFWTAGGATNWDVEYGPTGFSLGSGTRMSVTNNPTTLSGLSPNTAYDVYVRDSCGVGDVSNFTGPVSFTTLCAPFTAPYTESFDVANTTPSCWSLSAVTGGPWVFNTSSVFNTTNCSPGPTDHTGNGGVYAWMDHSGTDVGVVMEMNDVDVSALTVPQLEFYYWMCGVGYSPINPLYIEAWDGSAWQMVDSIVQGTTGWEKFSFDLSGHIYGTNLVRVRFRAESGGSTSDFNGDHAIDDVSIQEVPDCPAPTSPGVISVTETTAEIFWTTGGASNWDVEYGPTGFGLGSGTRISVTNDTITLTGLSPSSTYDVYVRDSCGVGDVSNFSGPATFTTSIQGPLGVTCVTGNPSVAFSEEFDSQGGWTGDIGTGSREWNYNSGTTSSTSTGPSGAHSGSNYIYYEASGSGADSASLISPAIDLTAATDEVELSFWLHAYGQTMGSLDIGVSTSPTGPFTNIWNYPGGELQSSSSDPWQQVGVNLDAYVGQTIYLEFLHVRGSSFNSDMALDLVEIETCLSCPTPSALGVTNITTSSADVFWTTAGATNWNVEYGPSGFSPGTGTMIAASNDTITLMGLAAGTTYDFYVQNDCGPGDQSAFSGPESFSTLVCDTSEQCTLSADLFDTFGDGWNGAEVGFWQNGQLVASIGNNFTSGASLLDVPVQLCDSLPVTVTLLAAGSFPGEIGFDVNYNYGVLAFNHSASSGLSTGDTLGSFSVQCAPPSCSAPSNLAVNQVTDTSANVQWMSGGATDAEVEYGPQGFALGSGTRTSLMDTNLVLSGLAPATLYDVYVRDSCGPGNVSTWAGPLSFATRACDTANACVFGVVITDTWGDGWNGGDVTLYQGGVPVTVLGQDFTGGASFGPVPVDLCDNLPVYAVLSTPGAFPEEMGIEIYDRDTTLVGQHSATFGLSAGDTLITFVPDCDPVVCLEPLALTSFNLQPQSAELTWMSQTPGFTNEVEYGVKGFTPGTGTVVTTTGDSIGLTGLLPATCYDYYVRTICPTGPSSWSVPHTFCTPCPPSPTYQQSLSICQGDSILVHGTYLSLAGVYIDTLTDAIGCDSIVETTLNTWPSYDLTDTKSICAGDSIFLGGAWQNTAGAYVDEYTTTDGCDSTITTQLTILPSPMVHKTDSICAGDSVLIGGVWRTTSGVYQEIFTFSNGCDSICVIDLTVLPVASGNRAESVCDGDSLLLHGRFVSMAGTYVDTLIAANGCDSVVTTQLNVIPLATATKFDTICDGDSIFLAGAWRTTTGIYTELFILSSGCDSICHINLTVLPGASGSRNEAICDGDSVLVHGRFLSTAGIYIDTLMAANMCDSVVTTTLSVNPTYSRSDSAFICQGDSVMLGGAWQTTSGIYVDNLNSVQGCDSIVTTTLAVGSTKLVNKTESICVGDSILLGGAWRSMAGTYYDTMATASGCDSVCATQLTVHPNYNISQNVSICEGDSLLIGANYVSAAGQFSLNLTTAAGCDSNITVTVSLLPAYRDTVQASICDGDSINVGGTWRTAMCFYTETFTASNGCDSSVVTHLMVKPVHNTSASASICVGDSIMAAGLWRATAGNYCETLVNSDGCDSVHCVMVNVLPTFSDTTMLSMCPGDSMMIAGAWRSMAGTFNSFHSASNGCDSVHYYLLSLDSTGCIYDCHGDLNGSAFIDSCGICAGGNTGVTPCTPACVPLEIVSMTLVDASTSMDVRTLANGDTIDKSVLTQFSIRANTCQGPVGSVMFTVNSVPFTRENIPPYAIRGGNGGNYNPWNPTAGTYWVDATPYDMANARGNAGIGLTLQLYIVDEPPMVDCNGELGGTAFIDSCGICVGGSTGKLPCAGGCDPLEVIGFSLIDANMGLLIKPLGDGDTIDLSNTPPFSIRADVCQVPVGSILFDFNGSLVQIENIFPYDIAGGPFSAPTAFNPPLGTHTVIATPYDKKNGKGMIGKADTVTFTVINTAGMAHSGGDQGDSHQGEGQHGDEAGRNSMAMDMAENAFGIDWRVYPNPTANLLNIAVSGIVSERPQVAIIDVSGKVLQYVPVYEQQAETWHYRCDLSIYPKGIYLIKLFSDREILTQRVMRR